MHNQPIKLSIIIPNHNYGHFLPRLFHSLKQQTMPLDCTEIIFVDDASTDHSVVIANQLGAEMRCSRFLQTQAGGKGKPGPVRNKGFSYATGELLFTIDADDLIAPSFLESCVATLDAHTEVDLVYTEQNQVSDTDEADAEFTTVHGISLPQATAPLLSWQNVVTSPAVFRRDVWKQSNGFRSNTTYEDWDFWVQAAANGFRFLLLKEPLFYYCKHQFSYSQTAVLEDAHAKARIVLNTPGMFHPLVRLWAADVVSGKSGTDSYPRGIIPLREDLLKPPTTQRTHPTQ